MLKRVLYSPALSAVAAAAVTTVALAPPATVSAATQSHGFTAALPYTGSTDARDATMFPIERSVSFTVHGNCTIISGKGLLPRKDHTKAVECLKPVSGIHESWPRFTPVASVVCAVNKVQMTRHASCGIAEFVATIVAVPSGKVLGTGEIAFGYKESLSASFRSWSLPAQIELAAATGVVKKGTAAKTIIDCTGGCASSGPWETPLTVGRVYSHVYHITSPGTGTNTTHQTPVITLANPASTDEPTAEAKDLGPARCDSIAYGTTSGCVFSDVAAVYYVYLKGHNEDQVANNIEIAEKTKPHRFGWYGHGKPLRRATSAAVASANRKAACGKTHYKKPYSCDEYPFAATFEGAAYYPGDNRTAKVLATQNSAEGAYRVNMYRTERLLNNDPYWVIVV
jgi:hypothetical protein